MIELADIIGRVEAQLAAALSPSRPLSPTSHDHEVQASLPPNALGAWVLSSFSALTNTPVSTPDDRIATPASWTALGGYCLAASIGIGVSLRFFYDKRLVLKLFFACPSQIVAGEGKLPLDSGRNIAKLLLRSCRFEALRDWQEVNGWGWFLADALTQFVVESFALHFAVHFVDGWGRSLPLGSLTP